MLTFLYRLLWLIVLDGCCRLFSGELQDCSAGLTICTATFVACGRCHVN